MNDKQQLHSVLGLPNMTSIEASIAALQAGVPGAPTGLEGLAGLSGGIPGLAGSLSNQAALAAELNAHALLAGLPGSLGQMVPPIAPLSVRGTTCCAPAARRLLHALAAFALHPPPPPVCGLCRAARRLWDRSSMRPTGSRGSPSPPPCACKPPSPCMHPPTHRACRPRLRPSTRCSRPSWPP
jgi:hypothetical protein